MRRRFTRAFRSLRPAWEFASADPWTAAGPPPYADREPGRTPPAPLRERQPVDTSGPATGLEFPSSSARRRAGTKFHDPGERCDGNHPHSWQDVEGIPGQGRCPNGRQAGERAHPCAAGTVEALRTGRGGNPVHQPTGRRSSSPCKRWTGGMADHRTGNPLMFTAQATAAGRGEGRTPGRKIEEICRAVPEAARRSGIALASKPSGNGKYRLA